jgi:hypothetical protein
MLKSNLTKLAQLAPALAGKVLVQTGEDIADLASQLAPVDSGDLRDSYKSEPQSESVVFVGSDLDYAGFVEYGFIHHSGEHIPAQPHLTPAFSQAKSTFLARMKREIEKNAGSI